MYECVHLRRHTFRTSSWSAFGGWGLLCAHCVSARLCVTKRLVPHTHTHTQSVSQSVAHSLTHSLTLSLSLSLTVSAFRPSSRQRSSPHSSVFHNARTVHSAFIQFYPLLFTYYRHIVFCKRSVLLAYISVIVGFFGESLPRHTCLLALLLCRLDAFGTSTTSMLAPVYAAVLSVPSPSKDWVQYSSTVHS